MTDTIPVWDRIADFWDAHLKEGNDFQLKLIMPTTDRLLGDVNRKHVMDACCGNGNYARRLAERGAKVTAFDGSAAFIEHAKQRTDAALRVAYRVIDATSDEALSTLDSAAFDAVVCSMAIMDLSTIEPLMRHVRRALKPGGPFVFSVCHPAFNSPRSRNTAELFTDDAGRARQRFGVTTEHYVTPYEAPSEGIINQPEPHPMFHRPISDLLKQCFAAGFSIDGFEEPAFPPGTPSKNAFSWSKRPEIPPSLVIRAR